MNIKQIILAGILSTSLLMAHQSMASVNETMTVFKTPWCGCCKVWVAKLEEAGFNIEVRNLDDLSSVKKQASVPKNLEGCHTAVLGEYVFEGHVPLAAIEKMLTEKPNVRGVSVPGMPQGSLGMGYDEKARYKVFSFHYDTSKPALVYYESGV